ncbi:Clan PC(S), family S51, peptidase E-like serine peptidase [Trichomonas vaginalis G3]|uniref:Clan PC(S), family S51, peptidase E-like serine peptidase n=1 Tax=Trichomonas vaginalis (strain ATCC PRA-98 / G3) TaxID=412133 RepID=A2G6V8_TRIV3|nr:Clan PC(S), family S51, peptidase E-like serine peptidase [Trichomonas vaginalis G3]EAX87115.1 Clan PC(S), family S51, peptidase E-like serine peptidase [Trichomonas vaginalis G3]KAI5509894.1 Clan PC(S), family S51, peptidase E-like serine peptidase [Trichomonas vaginalis G3]|eukprot:XP_001300045.1 Clan PC(S), family S51, peptidase E-like serine peptidase [Trichomonas vaginalis G3]
MKLFLCSYFKKVANLIPKAFGECSGKKVCYIPTAGIPEPYKEYLQKSKDAFTRLGMEVVELEVHTAPKEEIKQKVTECDLIFVAGGNTFFLLQELKESGAYDIIYHEVKNGKFYIGESAGTIIACKDIEYAGLVDSMEEGPKLKGNYSSFGFVNYFVLPHYTCEPFREACENVIKQYGDKLDLRPITNSQAVFADNDKFEVWTASQ